MVFPQDPRLRPAAAGLLRRLQAKGINPDGTTFYAYAAIQVLQAAAASAKSLDPLAVAAAIHSGMVFQTVLGDLAFDAKGDPTVSDLGVYVWHKGPNGRIVYDDQADG
jgi:branched-chain amino acid transport system substrate-binding protein